MYHPPYLQQLLVAGMMDLRDPWQRSSASVIAALARWRVCKLRMLWTFSKPFDFCVQSWTPRYKDVKLIESILRRAVKMAKGLESMGSD